MATVLILGATSDIGAAIAKKYASENYGIQLAARKPAVLEPLKSDISIRYPVACSTHAFDAVDYASHEGFFQNLLPKPDITICVFGILDEEEEAYDDWSLTERMIATNFTGAVSILNIASKYYIAQKAGGIIGISSVAGDRGRASKLIYASAKAGFTTYLSRAPQQMFQIWRPRDVCAPRFCIYEDDGKSAAPQTDHLNSGAGGRGDLQKFCREEKCGVCEMVLAVYYADH